ncbi:antibiotic biosynthesis monooxygenase [Epidermidibacterium keratini]|uniref:Antibiotic biosynthesis monooxygenase n=1 Tax=Epidermidibacterium keratini TaxID=1891644 RepID=A0A7L4YMY1_9ACTN|nr:antibiotic biosynthesis monooxygenase [Epidermidibacterium keratini]QHC00412.1 antibiotic biosynthesis monooxygenase [Epidermidibacterium keratini]
MELTPTFDAPYTAVIFSSLRTEGDRGYDAVSARMETLAAQQPGYLGVESARDEATGFGITVSYWRDHASAAAWKQVTEHERAQANGKRLWYSDYVVRIATVDRDYRNDRPNA